MRKSQKLTKIISSRELNKNPDYKSADTFNYEGARAWTPSTKDLFTQFLFTNTISNTFYVTQRGLLKQAQEVTHNALKELPSKEVRELIVEARNDGFMREAPIFALTELSLIDITGFQIAFNKVIRTGADMQKFLDYVRARRGLGRGIKVAIHDWLTENTSEFYALKYRKALRDAVNLSRPNAKEIFGGNEYKESILDWIKEKDRSYEHLKQISAYQELKDKGTLTLDEFKDLQNRAKLNQELITSTTKMSPEVWIEAAKWMGTFAFLKHLATFERNGILKDESVLAGLAARINAKTLQRAKVFPFRILDAHEMISDPFVKTHLRKTLEEYVPMYDFSAYGKTGIYPDVSGSMTWGNTGNKTYRTPAQIAGYLSGILHIGIQDSECVPWDTSNRHPILPTTVFDVANQIHKANGGGTYMELPIQRLNQLRKVMDTVIIVTDSEEWGQGWLSQWKAYKQNVAPEAKAFLIRVDPYGTSPISDEDKAKYDVYQFYGWNDIIFRMIDYVLKQ